MVVIRATTRDKTKVINGVLTGVVRRVITRVAFKHNVAMQVRRRVVTQRCYQGCHKVM